MSTSGQKRFFIFFDSFNQIETKSIFIIFGCRWFVLNFFSSKYFCFDLQKLTLITFSINCHKLPIRNDDDNNNNNNNSCY